MKIIIRDNETARTALAELLYGEIEQLITKRLNQEVPPLEPDDINNYGELLAILACNPALFNCISMFELSDLLLRGEEVIPNLNDFMFDFEDNEDHRVEE